jgi:hypothetical protein
MSLSVTTVPPRRFTSRSTLLARTARTTSSMKAMRCWVGSSPDWSIKVPMP